MTIRRKASRMIRNPNLPEVMLFDVAFERLRATMRLILQRQPNLVVAINGAGPDVGKTYLSGELAKELLLGGAPTGICEDPSQLQTAIEQVENYRTLFGNMNQSAYIFKGWQPPHGISRRGDIGVRENYDENLERAAVQYGLPLRKVDLWIALYAKGRTFPRPFDCENLPYDPFEDFIVLNDKVEEK